jgi:hypothetical protein
VTVVVQLFKLLLLSRTEAVTEFTPTLAQVKLEGETEAVAMLTPQASEAVATVPKVIVAELPLREITRGVQDTLGAVLSVTLTVKLGQ